MALLMLLLYLLCSLLTPISCRNSTSSDCDPTEQQALLSLKQNLFIYKTGYYIPFNRAQLWEGNRCCRWEGISCDERGHITKLRIFDSKDPPIFTKLPMFDSNDPPIFLNVTGEDLYRPLLNLKYLNHLDLTDSFCFHCTISKSIGSMKQLQFLGLPIYTSGEIPSNLGNLTGLRVLIFPFGGYLFAKDTRWLSHLTYLTRLEMTGVRFLRPADLTKVLCLLPSLTVLKLRDTLLDNAFLLGYFSNSNLSANVRALDLSYNYFSGVIPEGLQNFTSLEHLDLSSNFFDSSVPLWFKSMRNLVNLSLSYNTLERIEGGSAWLQSNEKNVLPIQLASNDLVGEIYKNRSRASKLKRLELQDNQLSGDIPGWLGELSELEVLDLSLNKLSGSVPSSFGMLLFLQILDLYSNRLNGTIPEGLGHLSNLEGLDFSQNSLNGIIPEGLGQLSNLKWLYLSQNSLNGVISEAHFRNLSKLSYLDLNENNLIIELDPSWRPPFQLHTVRMRSCRLGKFPRWIRTQKELLELDLSNASISDGLPEWIRETKISFLNISYNSITGPLPYWPEDLESIDVSYNSISGPLPDTAASMSKMRILSASNNNLGGSIPSSFCNMTSLIRLDLSKNKLRGSIPDCWSGPLMRMDFSANELSGSIPSSIGRLAGLSSLHLNNNRLSGELPPALSSCSRLVFLDLGENDLEGTFPTWMEGTWWNLPVLQFLRLRNNKLSGEIPSQLCTFQFLQVLDLAENRLTGVIPRCLGFMKGFNLNQKDVNQIKSMAPPPLPDSPSPVPSSVPEPPPDWGREHITQVMKGRDNTYTRIGLKLVTNLDISRNNLVGNIPVELGSLFGLYGLNLSRNHLNGSIPNGIGHMRSLESLDLSDNLLSGYIPRSISALTSLSQLNLSHNNLSGEIPKGSQIQTLEDPSNFADNPLLCADFLPRKCHPFSNQPPLPVLHGGENDQDEKLENLIYYAVATLGFACGFWGVIGSVALNKGWRLAYFAFADRVIDRAYVTLAVMARSG